MRMFCVLLLLASLALAQTATPPARPGAPATPAPQAPKAAGPDTPATPAPATVPPTAAVITIDGFCANQASTPAAQCKTVVTREEFEKLAHALNPAMPDPTKRQLANAYAQLLIASRMAEERGVASKPEAAEVLRFARMQALANLLIRDLQDEASKVPQAEIEKYYGEHKNQYEEASFQRVFISKAPSEPGKPVDEAKLKAEADKIRAAAAAGGDFEKLQKQAYEELGIKTAPPSVAINNVRRAAIPAGQAQVFDLAPGQLSQTLDEPGGMYVYKMVSKRSLPLSDVEQEIKRTLEGERMQQALEGLRKNLKPELNEAYFGPAPEGRPLPPGAVGVGPGGPPRPTPPGAAQKPGTTTQKPGVTTPPKPAPKTPPKP